MAKRFSSSKGPSQRQLRAGEVMRHALAEIFQRETLNAPALEGVSVTITEVRASPDLRNATAYCVPLGATVNENTDKLAIIKALNNIGPHLRGLLAKRVDLKYAPALAFRLDSSFDEAGRIDEILAAPRVQQDLDDQDDDLD